MKVMHLLTPQMKQKLQMKLNKFKMKETNKRRIIERKRKMLSVIKKNSLRMKEKFLMRSLKNKRFSIL